MKTNSLRNELILKKDRFNFSKITSTYFNSQKQHMTNIALSEINHIIATSDCFGVVYLFSLQIRKRLRKVTQNSQFISMKFSLDCKYLVIGQVDTPYNIILFNMEQGLQQSIHGHKSSITKITFLNIYLLSGSEDDTMRIWNIQTREQIISYKYANAVYGVSVDEKLKMIGIGSSNSFVYLYKYNLQNLDVQLFQCHFRTSQICKDLQFVSKLNQLITCGLYGIEIWDIKQLIQSENQQLPIQILSICDSLQNIQLVLDNKILIGIGGSATFFNLSSGSICSNIEIYKFRISNYQFILKFKQIAIHSDLKYAILGTKNGQIQLMYIKE